MFNKATAAVAEPASDVTHDESPVPVIHLALDLPEPPGGWTAFLNARGVEVVVDDLGRSAITRVDARRLFDEHREAEAVKAEKRAVLEQRAIEADQQFRAQLGRGVPIPEGMTYAEAVLSPELDCQSYRPRRRSLVEDLLSNDGITFHPIQHGPDEE
jgi:hypothetical protein